MLSCRRFKLCIIVFFELSIVEVCKSLELMLSSEFCRDDDIEGKPDKAWLPPNASRKFLKTSLYFDWSNRQIFRRPK